MSIYASFAASYDELFPIVPEAAAFLDSLARGDENRNRRALDAGCATGAVLERR